MLPSDGSLTVLANGFTDGFPNGVYPLTRDGGFGAPELQFLSIGTSPSDFSVNFIERVPNTALLSPLPNPCIVDGAAGGCFVSLFDEISSGIDKAGAQINLPVGGAFNFAPINYSFTVVPIPPAVWLFGSGLLGLVGVARRKRAA